MSTAIDTDRFHKLLLDERERVKEAIDYLHDENSGSIQDETQDSTADNHPGDMRKQPDAVFIVDLRKEQLAVREARRLGLPVIALVDTNCDPDEADFVIPGNDDAIRSCSLIIRAVAEGIEAGKAKATPADFTPPVAESEPEAADESAPEAEGEAEAEAETEPVPQEVQ